MLLRFWNVPCTRFVVKDKNIVPKNTPKEKYFFIHILTLPIISIQTRLRRFTIEIPVFSSFQLCIPRHSADRTHLLRGVGLNTSSRSF